MNTTSGITAHVHLHRYHLDVLQQVGSLLKYVLKERDFVPLHVNLKNVNDAVEVAESGEDVGVSVHLRVQC